HPQKVLQMASNTSLIAHLYCSKCIQHCIALRGTNGKSELARCSHLYPVGQSHTPPEVLSWPSRLSPMNFGKSSTPCCPLANPPPPAAPPQPPSLPLPRPQTRRRPPSPHRHPLRPQDRHPLGRPSHRDGLRLRHDLLAQTSSLATSRRLGQAAPSSAHPSGQ